MRLPPIVIAVLTLGPTGALGRGDAVSDGVGLAQLRVLPFGSVDAYAEEERLQKAHEALFHPHIFPSGETGLDGRCGGRTPIER